MASHGHSGRPRRPSPSAVPGSSHGRNAISTLTKNRAAAEAANVIRLAAQVPGSITDMPLNYANITDHKITNKVLVQSTRAVRDNGLLEARGRLVNCTDTPCKSRPARPFSTPAI